MKIVNFLLAVVAIIIALGAVALAFRGIALSRFASSSWYSWSVTEQADAVIIDTGGYVRGVTVCNRSFRRDDDGNAVIVEAVTGLQTLSHTLNHRSCISLNGEVVTVKKPEGESFSARGRYRLARGSRFGSRGFRMDSSQDEDDASSDDAADDSTDTADTGDDG